jgi:acetoacetate decarboxylase
MPDLQGYTLPLSPQGTAALVAGPPWYYAGNVLQVDYWADPQQVRAVLPPGLTLPEVSIADPDEARCTAIFVEFQSCGADARELLTPARSQYSEFALTVHAMQGDEQVTTCPYIWVDRDFALARGWIQGYPKKLASIWMTRSYGLDSVADPGLQPGAPFAAAAAANGYRLAEAVVTLEGAADGPSTVAAPPLLNVRHFPRLDAGQHHMTALHELARQREKDVVISDVRQGSASLELFPAPGEEHYALRPLRVGRGYRYGLSYRVDDLHIERAL